jgi:hypothetical protein
MPVLNGGAKQVTHLSPFNQTFLRAKNVLAMNRAMCMFQEGDESDTTHL